MEFPSIGFVLKWIWRFVLIAILFFNLRLCAPSPLALDNHTVPIDLVSQLNANRIAIDSGEPERMQQYFPEGYFFCHALHGLTWVQAALRDPSLTDQAIDESRRASQALRSRTGTGPFPTGLPPGHGMFYCAWTAHLQAGVTLLLCRADGEQKRLDYAAELGELRKQCDAIASALEPSATPFLQSYRGNAWPCDSFPAIHALVTCDRITQEQRYAQVVQKWLADALERLDTETNLFSHTCSVTDGRDVSVARATSQVIILRFLADIDPVLGRQHYQRFRDQFFATFAGIPCVLEYPKGISGQGDVDSGPLIFGRSISGTVLTIAAAQMYGDTNQAHAIAQAGEVVGLPWTSGDTKQYVGGILPVGDIIVGYAHVARPWFDAGDHHIEQPLGLSVFWRWKVHAISLLFLLPNAWTYIKRRRTRARASHFL
ncbi:hypothetical protein [Planctomycetes bacterium K23_9]|uniref:Uncharacterized protein n=1 Tax=Stieleria marina TaxID=1930275 RepID=A0A517NU58_9BACT|nr:hypothetical protein K239x_26130 [Planctomycetes bacterium K23_9]